MLEGACLVFDHVRPLLLLERKPYFLMKAMVFCKLCLDTVPHVLWDEVSAKVYALLQYEIVNLAYEMQEEGTALSTVVPLEDSKLRRLCEKAISRCLDVSEEGEEHDKVAPAATDEQVALNMFLHSRISYHSRGAVA